MSRLWLFRLTCWPQVCLLCVFSLFSLLLLHSSILSIQFINCYLLVLSVWLSGPACAVRRRSESPTAPLCVTFPNHTYSLWRLTRSSSFHHSWRLWKLNYILCDAIQYAVYLFVEVIHNWQTVFLSNNRQ